MKLTIHGRLYGLNEYIAACRRNPYAGAKMKNESETLIIMEIRRQLRGIHFKKPVVMAYRWYEKDRRRDLDNISSFGRKVIQDSLVKTKVLQNDGWRNITGFSDEFFIDKKNPRIEVIIEEVKNGDL